MSNPRHDQIAADEAAVEKQYNAALVAEAKAVQRGMKNAVANTWTTPTENHMPRVGELIGRVALEGPSELLDGVRDFYIGTARHDGDGYEVYSWAAPVACTYYRGFGTHHVLCDSVVGVRVFGHQGGRIVACEDEAIENTSQADLFPRRQLHVPRAPTVRSLPRTPPVAASAMDERPASEARAIGVGAATGRPILVPKVLPKAGPTDSGESLKSIPGPPIRTPELLRRQLEAPKKVAMSAVLATLQSDQYAAITKPASESQVLQGHPGTGKTIIAAHRAAFLLNAEAPNGAKSNGPVLILGPTVEYVEHVLGVLRELIDDPASYEVQAIPTLLEELAGLPRSTDPTGTYVWEDVSPDLARLIDGAHIKLRAIEPEQKDNPSRIYSELVRFLHDPPAGGLDSDWVKYLRDLPKDYEELRRRKFVSDRGLMAYIGVRTSSARKLGHVIVDEAQDIHPIEWEILGRLGNGGGWTILGDLNQRRTDHTYASWDDVVHLFGIEGSDGHAPVQILERGYRSTAQIIRFANQLLPAAERRLYSLQQDGDAPTVRRSPTHQKVYEMGIEEADSLLDRVGAGAGAGTGSVALIAADTLRFRTLLTRRGWKAETGDPYTWQRDEKTLRVLPPERARGLEFDGAVVVEPSDFPKNFGRQGVLYTALTRANRLLTVVHHRALPQGLKARL